VTSAEYEAEQLIEDFGLSLPVRPIEVCAKISTNSLTINYREEKFTTRTICGLSLGQDRQIEVVINSEIENLGRKRFTGAHEIGHVVLHIQTNKKSEFTCTTEDI
jgi:Zn-dependent peptidase ImmA (M78 family)